VIRAAGQISIGTDISGPNGMPEASDAGSRSRPKAVLNERVMPSAPYLALIGRLCSEQLCSEPFLIGSHAVLCPSNTGRTQLQLWTNNDIQVDRVRSLRRYSGTVGGFTVSVTTEPGVTCSAPSSASYRSQQVSSLPPGQVLRGSGWSVSSSQVWWKPFFVSLGLPLRIRASGAIHDGQRQANPDGLQPANGTNLVESNLPSEALIGRLCGSEQCGPAFLVGRERTLCPQPPYDDHLELWINRAADSRGRLGGSLPVTSDMFDLQTRRGEYRIEVSRAADDACRSPAR
jgi:hypothetical protein